VNQSPDPSQPQRRIEDITPPVLVQALGQGVLGQEDALKRVALAVYKHALGKVSGNLLVIGSSGTGKTTLMNAVLRLYLQTPEYRDLRAMAILNANLLVDPDRLEFRPDRLLLAVEQRARAVLGKAVTAPALQALMERATVCIDEVDKMSTLVAGKANPVGIVLQQGLLTLMEGGKVPYRVQLQEGTGTVTRELELETRRMLFLCGGAFESLYDQVHRRVTAPGSTEKLRSVMTRGADGQLRIEPRFFLADFFRVEDLFEYGMVPQFTARFDAFVLLSDLTAPALTEILLRSRESPFVRSKQYFAGLGIELELEDAAAVLIAEQAERSARIGARALRGVFGRLVAPLEFDPWGCGLLQPLEDGRLRLRLTADMVQKSLARPG